MIVGTAIFELHLPGVQSLKEKRSILKGLIARLHKTFNIACGEIALHDVWQSTSIGVAVISTTAPHAEQVIENVAKWIEHNRPDLSLVDYHLEIIHL